MIVLYTDAPLGAVRVSWSFLVLVCVCTQCFPSVATRVVAKMYKRFFLVIFYFTVPLKETCSVQ